MTNKNSLRRKLHLKAAITVLLLALTQLSLPLGNKAMTTPTLEPPPVDTCIAQSFVKIEKVKYGTDDGKDIVHVEWSNHANSSCVLFGGGFDVPGQSNITPFGSEVTVKVKRRFGHEDSATAKGTIITDGNDTVTNNVTIPRDRLETDPVSYEVKVRTTAGSVMSRTARLTGSGAPSLSAATQTSSTRSTVPNMVGTCFPTVQVSALNFLPGAGPKPDRVTINFAAGLVSTVAPCFDTPKVTIVVRVTRPNGVVDTGQANLDASGTTANISLPGTPGAVTSFEVLVTASTGSVVEKVSTSSGNF
jgi:hypothetical protein